MQATPTRPDPRPYLGHTEFNPPTLTNAALEVEASCLYEHSTEDCARLFAGLVTFVCRTGRATVQGYATPAQARQLAHQLTCAADAIDEALAP